MTSQDKRSRILVTRPAAEARETASILEKAGFQAILCPVLETKTLKPSLPRPEAIEAVIVTSKQAIRALAEYEDWKTLRQKPFWCVGESTAIFAQKHGVLSVFSSPSGHALSLTQEIINTLKPEDGILLYAAAKERSAELQDSLQKRGFNVILSEVYAMEPAKDLTTSLASLWQDPFTRPHGALFLSSRTAEIFVQSIPQSLKKAMQQDLQNVCLSHSVADPLKKAGFKHVYAAKHPDFEALLTLLSQVSL